MQKRNKAGKFERNGEIDLIDPLFVRLRPQLKATLARYAAERGLTLSAVVDELIAKVLMTNTAPEAKPQKQLTFKVEKSQGPHRFY